MGNLQGKYKIFSLETRKKIKWCHFTPYPMPDSMINKVKHFGHRGGPDGAFNFADRSGILFECNDEVDKSLKSLLKDELVPYPKVAAKNLGVVLGRHQPIPTVEDGFMLQEQAKDKATHNANLEPFDIAGVDPMAIIHANNDKIAKIANNVNNDDGIMAIADVPNHQTHKDTIILNKESDEDNATNDQDDDNNDKIGDHNNDEISDNIKISLDDKGDNHEEEDTEDLDEGQNVRCSNCKTKGKTSQLDYFNLFLVARRVAQGRPRQAIIHDGVMLFSDNNLSDAKPLPMEDSEEFALGVNLQQYSIGTGIKKNGKQAEQEVTKELTQLHDMEVFRPVHKGNLSSEERSKAIF